MDTTLNLLKKIQTKTVRFLVSNKVNIKNNSLDTLKILSNESNELIVSYEKNIINIEKIINYLSSQGVKITDISTDDGNLEDVFVELTKTRLITLIIVL